MMEVGAAVTQPQEPGEEGVISPWGLRREHALPAYTGLQTPASELGKNKPLVSEQPVHGHWCGSPGSYCKRVVPQLKGLAPPVPSHHLWSCPKTPGLNGQRQDRLAFTECCCVCARDYLGVCIPVSSKVMCERPCVTVIKGTADADSHRLVLYPWAGDLILHASVSSSPSGLS